MQVCHRCLAALGDDACNAARPETQIGGHVRDGDHGFWFCSPSCYSRAMREYLPLYLGGGFRTLEDKCRWASGAMCRCLRSALGCLMTTHFPDFWVPCRQICICMQSVVSGNTEQFAKEGRIAHGLIPRLCLSRLHLLVPCCTHLRCAAAGPRHRRFVTFCVCITGAGTEVTSQNAI